MFELNLLLVFSTAVWNVNLEYTTMQTNTKISLSFLHYDVILFVYSSILVQQQQQNTV